MTRADEGEGREPGQIAYEAHPTNDTLELLGAFGRSCKIGKHQATNWEHLRTTIHALDAAGRREEADTLLWQVWHRVNSAARHHEFYRIGLDEKYAAEARAAQAEAEVARLRERVATLEAALQPFANYAADMPGADFGEGEIGEYYHEGFRRSIRTQDLRAARTALEAPHADN